MLVLIDTPIWSLALRRALTELNPHEQVLTSALKELIRDGRAQLLGPVRQELLSGIRQEKTFTELRDYLRAFDEPNLSADDYEEAAHIHNQCRSRGIAGSAIDFLICAAAIRREWQIFTTDLDFTHYAKACPLQLYDVT
ncbi:MAG: PIN domain-containing protein [Candidatus Sulfotelmatobacter sp.]